MVLEHLTITWLTTSIGHVVWVELNELCESVACGIYWQKYRLNGGGRHQNSEKYCVSSVCYMRSVELKVLCELLQLYWYFSRDPEWLLWSWAEQKIKYSGHLTGHHVLLQLGHDRIAAVAKENWVPAANNDCAQIWDEYIIEYVASTTLHRSCTSGLQTGHWTAQHLSIKRFQTLAKFENLISEIKETYHADEN